MVPSTDALVSFLLDSAPSPLTAVELRSRFAVSEGEAADFMALLDRLTAEGRAVEIKGGRYAHPVRVGLAVGRLSAHPDGYGFVSQKEVGAPDIFVGKREMMGAFHGDLVVARVEKQGPKPSGRVIRILERAVSRLIGTLRVRKKYAVAVPLDERFGEPVYIHLDDLGGATDGQLVQVEITAYAGEGGPPEGIVVHVLGYPGNKDAEAGAIALKHKVRIEFPENALDEAKKLPQKVSAADIAGREDLRQIPFVTIDGEKAKDFDDAVHVELLPGGGRLLRVAIADVSHYVRPSTPIDAEALERGTSTYFPDRVFPMLPEALSNNLCSLVPRQDRLAMVAEMEYQKSGGRKSARFYPAVIRSAHRLTYHEVAAVLDDPSSPEAKGLADAVEGIGLMWELAALIRKKRKERGSIDFDLPEAEIVLDLSGRPEDIVRSERNRAHYLIEEFMIAANEAVAEHLVKKSIPAPFRIHEEPDPAKVEEFNQFIRHFGYFLRPKGKLTPKDFQLLVDKAEGKPEARMLNHVMLRTMKKAMYHYENLGHFGLASTHYLHFTSPIRRYPDLLVHRILKATFSRRGLTKKQKEELLKELSDECPRLSERERASEAAEREAVSWKKCQFMSQKTGERFIGFITSVAPFGFFVELGQYFVEGLVHVSSLRDDFYHFDETRQLLMGERFKKSYSIGDEVEVVVERVDEGRRQIDFILATAEKTEKKGAEGRKTEKPAKSGRGDRAGRRRGKKSTGRRAR